MDVDVDSQIAIPHARDGLYKRYLGGSGPNWRTSQGMITWRKIKGSGQTFTWRPRWPPCGLIHASLGTSPLFMIRYASEIGTCVSNAPAMISMGAVGFPSKPCDTRDIFGKIVARSSTVLAPS